MDWKMVTSEKAKLLIFWDCLRKIEMLELENLLNNKQTLLVRKMDFSQAEFFNRAKYGKPLAVDFLEAVDTKGRPQ